VHLAGGSMPGVSEQQQSSVWLEWWEMQTSKRRTLPFHGHDVSLGILSLESWPLRWVVPSTVELHNLHIPIPQPLSGSSVLSIWTLNWPQIARVSASPIPQGMRVLCPCQSVEPDLLCCNSASGICTEASLRTSASGSAWLLARCWHSSLEPFCGNGGLQGWGWEKAPNWQWALLLTV
jgi:hypothetical protein